MKSGTLERRQALRKEALTLLKNGELWSAYEGFWRSGMSDQDSVSKTLGAELCRLQKPALTTLIESLGDSGLKSRGGVWDFNISTIVDPTYDQCLKAMRPKSKFELGALPSDRFGHNKNAGLNTQPIFGFLFDSTESLEFLNFAKIPGIRSLVFQRSRPNFESFEEMRSLRYLEFSDLVPEQQTLYGRRDLECLVKHSSPLEFLSLGGRTFYMDDWSIELISQLQSLRFLSLSRCLGQDVDLSPLTDCPWFESLYLNETSLGQRIFDSLVHCRELKQLRLSAADIDEAAFARFAFDSQLTELYASGTPLTDLSLNALTYARQLQKIDLSSPRFTEEGYQRLASNKKLRDVRIVGGVTNAVVATLAENEKLRSLSLFNPRIDDDCVPALCQLSNLSSLRITKVNFSQKSLAKLKTALPGTHIKIGQQKNVSLC
ncbi:MAG: hypothetical protein P1V97_24865 [Planctomycetota bacterium]|nr:hypothetical protein [Planctomycetota bacterium]